MKEKKFVDGMQVKRNDRAPDFVVCNVGINVERFLTFAQEHKNRNGYVDVDILQARNGGYYAELNQWEPQNGAATANSDNDQDDPF